MQSRGTLCLKAAHRTKSVRTVQNASKGCLFSQKDNLPICSGCIYCFIGYYFGHIRYFGGDLRRKNRRKDNPWQCDIAFCSFYPHVRCCGYIECVVKRTELLFGFISFPPLWFSEDARPLSERSGAVFNGKYCRIFTDTSVIWMYFRKKKPIYTTSIVFVHYFS